MLKNVYLLNVYLLYYICHLLIIENIIIMQYKCICKNILKSRM